MLRISGGIHRSRQLFSPPGNDTRPTRSLVREAVFSMLMREVPDSLALDLFAGSGAMGLEALSRGARFSVFCDKGQEALACIRKNIDLLGLKEQSAVFLMDWREAVLKLREEKHYFNLIFLDPPYKMDVGIILSAINNARLLADDGIIVLETRRNAAFELLEPYEIIKERRYGDTMLRLIIEKEQGS